MDFLTWHRTRLWCFTGVSLMRARAEPVFLRPELWPRFVLKSCADRGHCSAEVPSVSVRPSQHIFGGLDVSGPKHVMDALRELIPEVRK